MKKKLLLLDGHSLAYRAFFALPAAWAYQKAVFGFNDYISFQSNQKHGLVAAAHHQTLGGIEGCDLSTRYGTLNVEDAATFQDNVQVDDNLNVDGLTTLDSTTVDGTLDVTGNTDIDGTLNVEDAATFQDNVQVDDNLNVDGLTTLDTTTVDGLFTVNGNAT